MKNEKLYDGITGIREDIVERTDAHEFKKKSRMTWQKWTALAACFCLVVGGLYGAARLGLFGGFGGASGGGGGGTGLTYMSYAGPVFPLTTLDGGEGLTAQRNIDFDFSPYESRTESYSADGEAHSYEAYDTESIVTDSYTLTNTTDEDMTVTAAYPFAAALGSSISIQPAIFVNGTEVETSLFVGPYSGGFEGAWGGGGESLNLDQLDSWEGYKALIEAGYIDTAFDAFPEMDQPVTVYELSEPTAPADTHATNPTLAVSFSLDYDKTTVLAYGFHAGSFDQEAGTMRQSFSIPSEIERGYGRSYYLVMVGDDIGAYTIQGYQDGGSDAGEEIDGVTAQVDRYETTLGEMMAVILGSYLDEAEELKSSDAQDTIADRIPRQTYLGLCAELLEDYGLLSDTPAERYDTGWLEDVFSEARAVQRVMYLTFEVTIPAGGSVDVTAKMVKDASIDFTGPNKNRNGYDLVTLLGSNLSFTAQTASIRNTEQIEILDQNFGFDLENGITEVELDVDMEHYWLEVRKLTLEETP